MPKPTDTDEPQFTGAEERQAALRPRWQRWLPAQITLVLGGCLSILAFYFVGALEKDRAIAAFQRAAEERLVAVEANIRNSIESIQALDSFYAASNFVDRQEFTAFTENFLKRRLGIRALEWAPRVRFEDLETFEREVHQSGMPEFQITERDEANKMVRASRRSEHFPVLYVEPLENNRAALGFDLGSVANRRATLEQAANSGQATATGRIRLVQEPGSFNTLVVSPVYQAGAALDTAVERRDALKGFVLGVFGFKQMFELGLAGESGAPLTSALNLHVVDESAAPSEWLMYSDDENSDEHTHVGDGGTLDETFLSGVNASHRILIGQRSWLLVATPSDKSYLLGTEWQARTVLVGGLAFTLLTAIYLIFLLNRTHTVARLVGQRTRALLLSNEGMASEVLVRKEAQEHLARSEHRIRSIIDAVSDGIVTLGRDGKIESFNKAVCMMFGRAAEQIMGQNLKALVSGDNVMMPLLTGEVTAERGSIGTEVAGLRRNGTTFPMEVTFTDMRIGHEVKHIATLRDITERKKIDRLKNEFVSTVSHELRTPLTSINGALSLIEGGLAGEIPDKASELIEVARRNGDRLVRLINDILDIEKIESGEMDIDFQPIHVKDLVERAVRANGGYASQFGIELRIAESLPSAEVYGGEDQLMQVLTNLISNATKFSPLGEAVALSIARAGPNIRISVADHGPGIDSEFRPRIFGKFSQGDSSDTRKVGGTGLGLNICRALVEMHGGRIDFETEAGKGTTFYFDLPEWNAAQESERGAA